MLPSLSLECPCEDEVCVCVIVLVCVCGVYKSIILNVLSLYTMCVYPQITYGLVREQSKREETIEMRDEQQTLFLSSGLLQGEIGKKRWRAA